MSSMFQFKIIKNKNNRIKIEGAFPDGPVVETVPSNEGMLVQSLFGELRSHMPWAEKPKHKIEARL